jgi:hypothetical protein
MNRAFEQHISGNITSGSLSPPRDKSPARVSPSNNGLTPVKPKVSLPLPVRQAYLLGCLSCLAIHPSWPLLFFGSKCVPKCHSCHVGSLSHSQERQCRARENEFACIYDMHKSTASQVCSTTSFLAVVPTTKCAPSLYNMTSDLQYLSRRNRKLRLLRSEKIKNHVVETKSLSFRDTKHAKAH